MTRLPTALAVALAWLALGGPAPAAADPWPDLSVPAAAQGGGKKDAALIVAVENYFQLPDVDGARSNALDWQTWLVRSRGVPDKAVHLLLDADATREEVLAQAREAAKRVGRGGTLWFVFVGHGAPSKDGRDGVLVGVDAQQTAERLYARSVRRSEVVAALAAGGAAHTVMVVDACFSGQASGRGGRLVTDLVVVPSSLPPVGGRGLVELTAGSPNQFAGPLPGAARPAFSYLVLGALRGWADGSAALGERRDGAITAAEVVAYAEGVIGKLSSGRRQTPTLAPPGAEDVLATRAAERGPDLVDIERALVAGASDGVVVPGVALDRGEDIVNELSDDRGFLVVRSDPPGATVTLNGEVVGTTPLQLEPMVGRYVIVAEHGKLYHPARQDLRLDTDGARVSLALRPAFGALAVTSEPAGAAVFVGGERAGTTPFRQAEKPSGRYHVRVTADDYLPHEEDVVVTDGGAAAVHAALVADFGALVVESEPPGARIALDGADTGRTTPHTFPRSKAGTHELRLYLDGHGAFVAHPTVGRGGEERVRARLDPKLGLLSVMAEIAGGAPCEGTLRVDGVARGTTPAKLELLATAHDVEVRCGDGVARERVVVEHNQRQTVTLRVAGSPSVTVTADPDAPSDRYVPREPRRSAAERFVYLGLALSEGALFTGGDTLRTNVGLEPAVALRWAWFRLELAGALTLESPVSFVLRPGVRADLFGPLFLRAAYQLLTTPVVTSGALFGLGGDIGLGNGWSLVAELDGGLWFADTGVVPLEGRLGVRYGF